MLRLFALASLLLITLSQSNVRASPCLSFDVDFNLYAFGFNGKDWNAGTQDVWATATNATDITTAGRPPFDGENTTCYLAQYFNAIYVLNGDAKNPSSVYIYDAGSKSWSKQATTPGSFDYSSFDTILDHDTNVFYALSKGAMYSLNMDTLKVARSGAIPWNLVQKPDLLQNYNPVMALAQNHIHFLNVGNDGPGKARIFVIHYSYLQPEVQSYTGEKVFPAAYGQATSFFKQSGVQEEFAFIPDDFSGTYVINVENNSTRTLPPPRVKDTKSSYVAGITSLVQLDSIGAVSFLPYVPGDSSANANATWTSIKGLPVVALYKSGSSTSNNPHVNGTGVPGNTDTSHSSSGGVLRSAAISSAMTRAARTPQTAMGYTSS
ncbi:hypothetical protein BDM02DRAFT_3153749 [Thelephora ganbajun]|uniref:Uncharacterized protein n=1 Tax=Thelephora ganbajun TaxID=370292 RepID=A0ACB6ZS61_THEGA|nr:hypothetical protein BDM02DRAFT_3153749 [Thelephora ganbajun]